MTEIITTILTGSIVSMLAIAPAFAALTDDSRTQKREANQGRRIDYESIEGREMTPKEEGDRDAREAKPSRDEEQMKLDGELADKKQTKLAKEPSKTGKKIYKKKHDEKKIAMGKGK